MTIKNVLLFYVCAMNSLQGKTEIDTKAMHRQMKQSISIYVLIVCISVYYALSYIKADYNQKSRSIREEYPAILTGYRRYNVDITPEGTVRTVANNNTSNLYGCHVNERGTCYGIQFDSTVYTPVYLVLQNVSITAEQNNALQAFLVSSIMPQGTHTKKILFPLSIFMHKKNEQRDNMPYIQMSEVQIIQTYQDIITSFSNAISPYSEIRKSFIRAVKNIVHASHTIPDMISKNILIVLKAISTEITSKHPDASDQTDITDSQLSQVKTLQEIHDQQLSRNTATYNIPGFEYQSLRYERTYICLNIQQQSFAHLLKTLQPFNDLTVKQLQNDLPEYTITKHAIYSGYPFHDNSFIPNPIFLSQAFTADDIYKYPLYMSIK